MNRDKIPVVDTGQEPSNRDELDRSLVRGIAWAGTVKWGTQFVTWASTLIVARILSPSDYGVVTMAAVYLGVLSLISEFGVGSVVVAHRNLLRGQLAQLNSLSVMLGIAGFVVSCIIAHPLGRFFGSRQLPAVLIVMSTSFVISSFQSVPASLLQKELQFKWLSLIDGVGALALAVLTVILALMGLRYWTLVVSAILSTLLGTIFTLAKRRHAFAWPRASEISKQIRFSWHIIVGRLAWYSYSNADFVVVGRILGQVSLGAYSVAWNLANAPLEKITGLVGRVTPAYFSAVQDDCDALRRYLLKLTEAMSMITFPAMMGLALVAHDLVLVALGRQWQAVITPLQLLAVYCCFRSVMPLMAQVLIVLEQTRFVMWNGIVSAVVLPLAFLLGTHWGTTGVAAVWVVAYPINAVPLYILTSRKLHMGAAEYLRAIRPALSGTAVMAAAVFGVKLLLPLNTKLVVGLTTQVCTGIVVYVTAMILFHRERVLMFHRALKMIRT